LTFILYQVNIFDVIYSVHERNREKIKSKLFYSYGNSKQQQQQQKASQRASKPNKNLGPSTIEIKQQRRVIIEQ